MTIYTAGYEAFWKSPEAQISMPLNFIETRDRDAGLRAVEAAVRADQLEKDAQIAAGDHRPTGYGIGALNSGSRSQWYSRGRDQAGFAIRAQLPALVSEPSQRRKP